MTFTCFLSLVSSIRRLFTCTICILTLLQGHMNEDVQERHEVLTCPLMVKTDSVMCLKEKTDADIDMCHSVTNISSKTKQAETCTAERRLIVSYCFVGKHLTHCSCHSSCLTHSSTDAMCVSASAQKDTRAFHPRLAHLPSPTSLFSLFFSNAPSLFCQCLSLVLSLGVTASA